MKQLAVLFGLFMIGVIVYADLGMLGILRFVNRVPYGDKIGHFVLYGILTLLIDLALIRPTALKASRRLTIFRVALILALLIGLEEFSQRYFPDRTFDLIDLTFSYLGVVFFSWIALRIKS